MPNNRLLVVDDDERTAALICKVAIEADFVVAAASNDTTFINSYNNFQPDVIVLDILMPKMDGFEVLQYLSKQQSKIRVIILSGQDSYREMAERQALALGLTIDGNIPKPFRIAQLRETLIKINDNISKGERKKISGGAA